TDALEAATALPIIVRADTGERGEVVNQMRLIVVSALHGELRPIDGLQVLRAGDSTLKTHDAAKHFRRESYLAREQRNEPPLAQLHGIGEIVSSRTLATRRRCRA